MATTASERIGMGSTRTRAALLLVALLSLLLGSSGGAPRPTETTATGTAAPPIAAAKAAAPPATPSPAPVAALNAPMTASPTPDTAAMPSIAPTVNPTAAPTATPAPLPAAHVIDGVPAYAQDAPLSCEYAATTAATAYYGQEIPEATFMAEIGEHPDPNKGFRGDIYGWWGGTDDYGIYPGPILAVLARHGFPHSYRFDADETALRVALAHDHPVVAWIVGTYSISPRIEETRDGTTYFLVPYEHAVTLYGYDEAGVWVMDVGDGSKYHVGWETFTPAWMQLDGMALVPLP